MKKILLCFYLLLLFSCAASVTYQPIISDTYPPTEKVDVYKEQKPERDFIQLGMILVSSEGSEKLMLQKAIKKAKEVGADGIIVAERIDDTGRWRVDKRHKVAGKSYMKFIAIKYVESKEIESF